jgi:hypothetical protein
MCGTNVNCVSYLNSSQNLQNPNLDYKVTGTWSFELNEGSNQFNLTQETSQIHLPQGTMLMWISNGGSLAFSSTNSHLSDYKLSGNMLTPLNGSFSASIYGLVYAVTLLLNSTRAYSYPGVYQINAYAIGFSHVLTTNVTVSDDPVVNISCTNLTISTNESVSCFYSYLAQTNLTVLFKILELNQSFSFGSPNKTAYSSYFGGLLQPTSASTFTLTSGQYLLLNTEFLNDTLLTGFQLNVSQPGSVDLMVILFLK